MREYYRLTLIAFRFTIAPCSEYVNVNIIHSKLRFLLGINALSGAKSPQKVVFTLLWMDIDLFYFLLGLFRNVVDL